MKRPNITPGPWPLGEYDPNLGYDSMTGGIRVGPIYLDGASYGQRICHDITPEQQTNMEADARAIAALPDLIDALLEYRRLYEEVQPAGGWQEVYDLGNAALTKAGCTEGPSRLLE